MTEPTLTPEDFRLPKGDDKSELCRLQAKLAAIRERAWVGPDSIVEQDWYWWWNGDLDCCPVPVSVMRSGTDGTFFASTGQLGWTRAQNVVDMGGLWQPIIKPDPPYDSALIREIQS